MHLTILIACACHVWSEPGSNWEMKAPRWCVQASRWVIISLHLLAHCQDTHTKKQAAILVSDCLPKPAQTPCFCLYKWSDVRQSDLVCLVVMYRTGHAWSPLHAVPEVIEWVAWHRAGARAKRWVCYVQIQHGLFLDLAWTENVRTDNIGSCVKLHFVPLLSRCYNWQDGDRLNNPNSQCDGGNISDARYI